MKKLITLSLLMIVSFVCFAKEVELTISDIQLEDSIYLSNYSEESQNIKISITDKKNKAYEIFNNSLKVKTDFTKIDSDYNDKYKKYKTIKIEFSDDIPFHYYMKGEDLYFELMQTSIPNYKKISSVKISENKIEDNIIVKNWTSSKENLFFFLKKKDGFVDLGNLTVEKYKNITDFKVSKKLQHYDEIIVMSEKDLDKTLSVSYQVKNDDFILIFTDEINSINASEKSYFGYRTYTSASFTHKINNSNDFINKCVNWLLKDLSSATIEYKDENLKIIKASIEDYIFVISLEGKIVTVKMEPKPDEKYIKAEKVDERFASLFNYLDNF